MTKENDQVDIKDEDTQENDFTQEELDDDATDWKAKATELKGIAKRRATQLSKAKDKIKSLSTPEEKPTLPEKKEESQKSNELDYGQKAFLNSNGIKGSDELSLVKSEVERSSLTLDELIDNPYFQGRLTTLREARATKEATPSGTKRSQVSTKDSVEYHIEKYKNKQMELSDMPFEMRGKVLTAVRKEKTNNPFA